METKNTQSELLNSNDNFFENSTVNSTGSKEQFDPGGSEEEFNPGGCFIQEGIITDEMKQFLKKLTVADIRDFLSKENTNESPFPKEDRVPPPQYHLESSRGEVKDRFPSHTLELYFGGRTLKYFKLLSQLGEGLIVIDAVSDVPSIGNFVNYKREKWKKKGGQATVPLEVVGMDIGYGNDVSIGDYKYVLILVDKCTRNSFVYRMHGSSGADVSEVLWKFFIDAGGFPKTLQCDFDSRIIGGKAAALLCSHGTWIRVTPPRQQDKNSVVE